MTHLSFGYKLMILSIVTSFTLLGVFYSAPATTTNMYMLVECSYGFYSASMFPARSGQGSRELRGDMDGECNLYMEAHDKDSDIVDRETRKFFAAGPLGPPQGAASMSPLPRVTLVPALLMALAMPIAPPVAIAHEGHPHRFMGTVSAMQNEQIEVTLTDGTLVAFALDAKTIYRQGKTKVIGRLPKDGERVVVSAMPVEKVDEVMIAITVQLPLPSKPVS